MNKINGLNAAVIGFGYWGPNLARNLVANQKFKLKYICDQSSTARDRAKIQYPNVHVISNYLNILEDREIDAEIGAHV